VPPSSILASALDTITFSMQLERKPSEEGMEGINWSAARNAVNTVGVLLHVAPPDVHLLESYV
jgi:hypothetical protein